MKKLFISLVIIFSAVLLTACTDRVYEVVTLPTEDYEYLSDYLISIESASTMDSFEYTLNDELLEMESSNGHHFLKLEVTFDRKIVPEQTPDGFIELSSFKLKDHADVTGVYNHFSTIEGAIGANGSSTEMFSVPAGSEIMVTMYFEIPDEISLINSPIYLEVDFIDGETGIDIPITQQIESD